MSDPNTNQHSFSQFEDLYRSATQDWYVQYELGNIDPFYLEDDTRSALLASTMGERSLDPELVSAYRAIDHQGRPFARVSVPVILCESYTEAVKQGLVELFDGLAEEGWIGDFSVPNAKVAPLSKLGRDQADTAWEAMAPVDHEVLSNAFKAAVAERQRRKAEAASLTAA